MSSNKAIGNAIEKRVATLIAKNGYWVHRVVDSKNGQPFDIIAIKDCKALCVEVKHVARLKYLSVSRLEENQIQAYHMLKKANSDQTFYIAVNFGNEDEIYMTKFEKLLDKGKLYREDMSIYK